MDKPMPKPIFKVDGVVERDLLKSKIVMHKPMESDKRHRSIRIELFTAAGKNFQTEYYWSKVNIVENGFLIGPGYDFFPRSYKTVASAIQAAVKEGWSITI